MSSFDDNPFGEPTVDNPFSDPSVQQMTKKPSNIEAGLEDYNPFDPASQQKSTVVRGAANPPQYAPGAGPAVMAPSSQNLSAVAPPPYSKFSQQTQPAPLTTSELQRRQEELDRKAAELERREEELRRNEFNVRRNNWPPLPENCFWQPCFYLDINVEIQPEFQTIVTQLYKLWQLHAGLLICNFAVFLLLWLLGSAQSGIALIVTSLFYGGLFIPLSFLCWFRPGYKAFKFVSLPERKREPSIFLNFASVEVLQRPGRNDSSFNFMVFFFIFFFQLLFTTLQATGFIDGYAGLVVAFRVLEETGAKAKLGGILALIVAIGLSLAACADLYLLTRIHNIYRSSGASFAKAQAEFTTEFLRNEHVRGAAANMAQAAVRQQFSQPQQPPSNRY